LFYGDIARALLDLIYGELDSEDHAAERADIVEKVWAKVVLYLDREFGGLVLPVDLNYEDDPEYIATRRMARLMVEDAIYRPGSGQSDLVKKLMGAYNKWEGCPITIKGSAGGRGFRTYAYGSNALLGGKGIKVYFTAEEVRQIIESNVFTAVCHYYNVGKEYGYMSRKGYGMGINEFWGDAQDEALLTRYRQLKALLEYLRDNELKKITLKFYVETGNGMSKDGRIRGPVTQYPGENFHFNRYMITINDLNTPSQLNKAIQTILTYTLLPDVFCNILKGNSLITTVNAEGAYGADYVHRGYEATDDDKFLKPSSYWDGEGMTQADRDFFENFKTAMKAPEQARIPHWLAFLTPEQLAREEWNAPRTDEGNREMFTYLYQVKLYRLFEGNVGKGELIPNRHSLGIHDLTEENYLTDGFP